MKKYFLLFLCVVASAAAAIEREAYVRRVYGFFPHALKFVMQQPAFNELSEMDKYVFHRIEQVARAKPKVDFSLDEKEFILNLGESPKLMGTRPDVTYPIYVNLRMLSEAQVTVDIPWLLKIYFHELSHKIGPIAGTNAQKEREAYLDRLGQFFENQLRPHFSVTPSADLPKMSFLTLPFRKLGGGLEKVPVNSPQPSFLVFAHRPHDVVDLTDTITKKIEASGLPIRTVSTILNAAAYFMFRQMAGPMKQMMSTFFNFAQSTIGAFQKGFGLDETKFTENPFNNMPEHISELRVLEINEAEVMHEANGVQLIRIKGQYILGGTQDNIGPNSFSIEFKGNQQSPEVYTPLMIHAYLPDQEKGLKNENIQVQGAPALDLSYIAQAKNVQRQGDVIRSLTVEFVSPAKPSFAHLVLSSSTGKIHLREESLQALKDNTYRANFNLSEALPHASFFTDSIVINGDRAVFFDRLIEVNQVDRAASRNRNVQIVTDSLGLWGMRKGEQTLQKDFKLGEGAYLMHASTPIDHFHFSPEMALVEFQLNRHTQVKEVRFYFKRTISLWMVDPKEYPLVEGEISGHKSHFTPGGGTPVANQDIDEVAIASLEDIQHSYSRDGRTKIIAKLTMVPFKQIRPLKDVTSDPTKVEAEGLPTMHPFAVEIVTADMVTLNHILSKPLSGDICSFILGDYGNQIFSDQNGETFASKMEAELKEALRSGKVKFEFK